LRESSKGHARRETLEDVALHELRAHRAGQILPDHAPTKQEVPSGMFNRGSLM
jgi:hypothetical protein